MLNKRPYQIKNFLSEQVLAADADVEAMADFEGMIAITFCLETTYATVDPDATGVSVTVYPGFNKPGTAGIVYADNGTVIPGSVDPVSNGETRRFAFALDLSIYGQFAKIVIQNSSAVNPISAVTLYGVS